MQMWWRWCLVVIFITTVAAAAVVIISYSHFKVFFFQRSRSKIVPIIQLIRLPPHICLIDLQREFPDTFKVWYDSLGGDAIGLTWEKSGSKVIETAN